MYAIKEWSRLYTESGHSLIRKIVLTMELIYMSVNLSKEIVRGISSDDVDPSSQYVSDLRDCSQL